LSVAVDIVVVFQGKPEHHQPNRFEDRLTYSRRTAMTASTTPGTASLVGKVEGTLYLGGQTPMEFHGEANLYFVQPPLRGHSLVVASTVASAVHLGVAGRELGVETFLFGVIGDGSALHEDELPGSGWGNSVDDAFAQAGYVRTP